MKKRNWLDLYFKLVDRYDLDQTMEYIQEAAGKEALAYWGEGVLSTKLYPNPFVVTRSGIVLGGSFTPGICYDANGQIIQVDSVQSYVNPTAHPTLPRWDVVVARFKLTGDTPVPKPSAPLTTIFLNFHDDFDIVVIPGTANASPAYPAVNSEDVKLFGVQIPAAATLGTQCTIDLTIRENGSVPANRVRLDTTNINMTKVENLQGFVEAMDGFLSLGAQTLGAIDTINDFAVVTCNTAGTNGHSITVAGQVFTIGPNVGAGQIPVQASAQQLAYALSREIKIRAGLSAYTASSSGAKVTIYAKASGAVGGALSVSGGTFSISGATLSGNTTRKVLLSPGLQRQLDEADIYLSTLMPIGGVLDYAGSTIPIGWLPCNGAVVSQTTYANLFAAISTTWNTGGEGAGNFRLPDTRGRVRIGAGTGTGLTARVLGVSGGEETHLLVVGEIPLHTHFGTTTSSLTTHTHVAAGSTGVNTSDHSHAAGSITSSIPTVSTGALSSGSTRVPGYGGAEPFTGSAPLNAFSGNSAGQSNTHLHNFSVTTDTANLAHVHTVTTDGGTGGGAAHNNMQPFTVFNAIIKY